MFYHLYLNPGAFAKTSLPFLMMALSYRKYDQIVTFLLWMVTLRPFIGLVIFFHGDPLEGGFNKNYFALSLERLVWMRGAYEVIFPNRNHWLFCFFFPKKTRREKRNKYLVLEKLYSKRENWSQFPQKVAPPTGLLAGGCPLGFELRPVLAQNSAGL